MCERANHHRVNSQPVVNEGRGGKKRRRKREKGRKKEEGEKEKEEKDGLSGLRALKRIDLTAPNAPKKEGQLINYLVHC